MSAPFAVRSAPVRPGSVYLSADENRVASVVSKLSRQP